MEIIKNKRILALIGIVCLFIGTIAPYFSISFLGVSYNLSLWKYWEGKVIMVLIIINTMFIFKDYLQKYVPQVFNSSFGKKIENANPKFAIIPTILVAAFVIYLTIHLDVDSQYIKHGLGFWVLWIGIISLVGHTIFYKKQVINNNQTVQSDQFNQNVNLQQPMSQSQDSFQQPVQPMSQPQDNFQQPVQPMNGGGVQNIKYCTQCGNKVDQSAKFCNMCGHNF